MNTQDKAQSQGQVILLDSGVELLPPSISAVPADWPQASSWHFEGFALDITPWTCQCCNDTVVHSQLFRMFVRHFPDTTDRRFVPATQFVEEFPVIRFERLARTTAICAKCVSSVEGNKTFKVTSEAEFKLAAKRAQEAAAIASKSRKPNVVKFETKAEIAKRLEDLL